MNTPAQALAGFVGNEIRAGSIYGVVKDEPKIDSNDNATFRLKLTGIELDEQTLRNDALVYAHLRGVPQIGDELALFGTIEPIQPPRNPGELGMPGYLARRGVTRAVVVRYPENGRIVRKGSAFSLFRAAANSRE